MNTTTAKDVSHFVVLCANKDIGYFAEIDLETSCSKASVIENIISGELHRPLKIFSFNVVEGWARDVTEDLAREVADRLDASDMIPDDLIEFVAAHAGEEYARGLRSSDKTFAAG